MTSVALAKGATGHFANLVDIPSSRVANTPRSRVGLHSLISSSLRESMGKGDRCNSSENEREEFHDCAVILKSSIEMFE